MLKASDLELHQFTRIFSLKGFILQLLDISLQKGKIIIILSNISDRTEGPQQKKASLACLALTCLEHSWESVSSPMEVAWILRS